MTYVAVGLLVVGVVLMIADGISPLSGGPGLDLATLGSQLLALDPAGVPLARACWRSSRRPSAG